MNVVSPDIIDFVYVDMDGVIADFDAVLQQHKLDAKVYKYRPGAYVNLPVYPQAAINIEILRRRFPDRVWFLSKPPSNAPYVWAEKALWIREHFGDEGLHNLIITMDKSHVGTEKSVLIDDRAHKGGVSKFRGSFYHFGQTGPKFQHWLDALEWVNRLIDQRST